jgi:hypothetical protein
MFDRTQYVVEKKLVPLLGLDETYGVKDVNGNLLGYIKRAWGEGKFWFEGVDGTRRGEIRYKNETSGPYEVYDAQKSASSYYRMGWGTPK